MASNISVLGKTDVMSGIVFWRHVWHQKATQLYTCNQLYNFSKRAFKCTVSWVITFRGWRLSKHSGCFKSVLQDTNNGFEASFVEVGQVISCIKSANFLTPDMASKNASGHPSFEQIYAMSGVKKLPNFIPAITCPNSANEPSI